jgi:hypothetical protein
MTGAIGHGVTKMLPLIFLGFGCFEMMILYFSERLFVGNADLSILLKENGSNVLLNNPQKQV